MILWSDLQNLSKLSMNKWSVIKDIKWLTNYMICCLIRRNLKMHLKHSKAQANLARLASNVRGAAELSVYLKGTSLQRRLSIAREQIKN